MMNTSTDAHRNVLRYDQLEREAASDRPFLLPLVTRVGNEADLQDRVLELASRATLQGKLSFRSIRRAKKGKCALRWCHYFIWST